MRDFLGEPSRLALPARPPAPRHSAEAARRLFAASRPIAGTLAETYLRSRGITARRSSSLRFHPSCYYHDHDDAPLQTWPALLAAVSDLAGHLTGVHRTWLSCDGGAKAPVADPRRSLGQLLGNAVRFGTVTDVLAATEGIETALALKSLLPSLPVVAALSAAHLGALLLPPALRRLYVAADNDEAGMRAAARLMERAEEARIEAHPLLPCFEDWNAELCALGSSGAFRTAAGQLLSQDADRFAG